MNKITITLEVEAEELNRVLEALSGGEPKPKKAAKITQLPEPKPELESASAPEPVNIPDPIPDDTAPWEVPAVTKTDIRKAALALSKAGKQDALQAVYAKYGAEKLSDFTDESLYAQVLKDLEAANA